MPARWPERTDDRVHTGAAAPRPDRPAAPPARHHGGLAAARLGRHPRRARRVPRRPRLVHRTARPAGRHPGRRARRAHRRPAPPDPHAGASMSELITTRIRGHATRLTLPHLAEHLDTLIARAEADTMGYLEFVDLLLGEEVGLREGRRFRAALKLSGLPHHKSLDAFDFAFQPDLDTRKIRDLASLQFVPSCSDRPLSTV